MMPGVIAIPHGWGHRSGGGWRTADGAGGANVNVLASSAAEDLERLVGMAVLNGIPVRLEPVRAGGSRRPRQSVAAERLSSGAPAAASDRRIWQRRGWGIEPRGGVLPSAAGTQAE